MTIFRFLITILITIVALLSSMTASAQTIIRVDKEFGSPTPAGFGNGWNGNAYKFLQDALTRANTLLDSVPPLATSVEIWVRANTYRPDETSTSPTGSGNRDASFQLRTNVAILGGKRD